MKHLRLAAALAALLAATGAQAETTLRVGFCARTVSAAAAPFAIAAKMGWFTQAGFRVELVPFPGSTDCVKSVATRDVDYALPSIEPLAIIRPQGVKAKNYYTAYQGNVYGIAVPADSAVKRFEDLKGKRVGVISMSSAGVIIARALAANHGMDPDRDISIVVAGEAAQTAALLRSGEVDALSQFDTQYALVEKIGRLNELNGVLYNRQLALFYADHELKPEAAYANAAKEYSLRQDIYGADALAWTALKAGKIAEAQTAIKAALRLGTEDARLFYHSGMIARASGDKSEAHHNLKRALALNPQFDPLQASIARKALGE